MKCCVDCANCVKCSNQQGKKFMILDIRLTAEEFKKRMVV